MSESTTADHQRYQWETPAMRIVEAVKRELLPAMAAEEGGWLLGQILDLTTQVRADLESELALRAARAPRPQPVEPTPLEIDIADVVTCFQRWNANQVTTAFGDLVAALYDLSASWKKSRAAAPLLADKEQP